MPKILVIDDSRNLRQMVSSYLEQEGWRVVTAANCREGLRLAEQESPDLIILDLMMPEMGGYEFLREVGPSHRTPIIVLTARMEESDKVLGLELGADDYVTKPFSPRELTARIKAVLRRHAPQATEDVVEIGGLRLDPGTHRVRAGDAEVNLGPTEFRLLHFLMTHPERVHGRSQLLDQVWGDHIFVEERTVDVHIRRLRAALESSGCDTLIQTVRGSGYRISAG